MTQKEAYDFALDLMSFLDINDGTNDPAEVANAATDMVKAIIKRHKPVRDIIWMEFNDGPDALQALGIKP